MKERKRWGRKFKDKRDWRKYNEQLVVRGEFELHDCRFILRSYNITCEPPSLCQGKPSLPYEQYGQTGI